MCDAILSALSRHYISPWLNLSKSACACIHTGRLGVVQKPYALAGSSFQRRTAKTHAALHLGDLSQRPAGPGINFPDGKNNGPVYPTVVQQALDNMRKFENCVLLTKVGSFYEVCSRTIASPLLLIPEALPGACGQVWSAPQPQGCPEENCSWARLHGTDPILFTVMVSNLPMARQAFHSINLTGS